MPPFCLRAYLPNSGDLTISNRAGFPYPRGKERRGIVPHFGHNVSLFPRAFCRVKNYTTRPHRWHPRAIYSFRAVPWIHLVSNYFRHCHRSTGSISVINGTFPSRSALFSRRYESSAKSINWYRARIAFGSRPAIERNKLFSRRVVNARCIAENDFVTPFRAKCVCLKEDKRGVC